MARPAVSTRFVFLICLFHESTNKCSEKPKFHSCTTLHLSQEIKLDPFTKTWYFYLIISNLLIMNSNTSISLGGYFERFIERRISTGRYKNASELIRAALRLLEEEELKVKALKEAMQEGIDSGLNPVLILKCICKS